MPVMQSSQEDLFNYSEEIGIDMSRVRKAVEEGYQ